MTRVSEKRTRRTRRRLAGLAAGALVLLTASLGVFVSPHEGDVSGRTSALPSLTEHRPHERVKTATPPGGSDAEPTPTDRTADSGSTTSTPSGPGSAGRPAGGGGDRPGGTGVPEIPAPAPATSAGSDDAGGSAQVPDQPAPEPGTAPSDAEAAVVALTNQVRAQAGCGPVAVNGSLMGQAQVQSDAQAASDRMFHSHGIDGFPWWGENVAYGYADAAAVMGGWMGSPSHRENILNCRYTYIGVGLSYSADGTPYWTQQFASVN